MIKKWLIRGDTHGAVKWVKHIPDINDYKPEEVAIIILGDVAFNFYLDNRDNWRKTEINKYGYQIYCVRGNHEARPTAVKDIKVKFDDAVGGEVYYEEAFPNIKYFKDWGIYKINNYSVGVVGGGYSVDKWYRLENGYPWFVDEVPSAEEIEQIKETFKGKSIDIMLTHVAPYNCEPIDLFMGWVDQSTVDVSLEHALNDLYLTMPFGAWCWGHYHQDRIINNKMIMLYDEYLDIEDIYEHKFWKANLKLSYTYE